MKPVPVHIMLLVAVLLVAQAHAARKQSRAWADADPYKVKVAIVNEKSLPPSKLADALYAKAGITFDIGPLKRAASLDPNDPVYWYRLATWVDFRANGCHSEDDLEDYAIPSRCDEPTAAELKKQTKTFRERRSMLERALSIDPDYLPALYVYAITKPSHRQRMQALEDVAKIHKDNAKPYYIMAILQSEEVSRGKKWIVGSQAYVLSDQEWNSVLDLLRKGNERAVFRGTPGQLPSITDIRVSTNGEPWPASSVENDLRFLLNELRMGGLAESPLSFTFSARARQLARQSLWEVQQCVKNGKGAEATDMAQAMQSFGDKEALSEPRRFQTFAIGVGLKSFAFMAESAISSDPSQKKQLDQQSEAWHKLAMDVLDKSAQSMRTTDKAVKTSKREYLQYPDFAAEEKQVDALIQKMGLGTKG